jgi:hypothetical protein
MTTQHTADGTKYEVSEALPADQTYPRAAVYTFGEFAGPVIEAGGRPAAVVEFGGYGDVSLTDPWTGRRLSVLGLPDGDEDEDPDGLLLIAAIRTALDVAAETRFFAAGR